MKAPPFALEANTYSSHRLLQSTRHLSERELTSYIHLFKKDLDIYLSFIHTQTKNNSLRAICYDNALFHKGFLLSASKRVRHLAQSDTAAMKKFNDITVCHRRLAKLYAKTKAEQDTLKATISQLEAQANSFEKDLNRTVAGYGEALRQVSWQKVQASLKPGEAAVEFVHYNFYTPKLTDSIMYAALVVRPGDAVLYFVPLFEERALADKRAFAASNNSQRINELYAPETRLYDLIWQPLDKLLKGVKTVYCSPSGILHEINLAALPYLKNDKNNHSVVVLGSTRFLVVSATISHEYKLTAHLVGGVRYEAESVAIKKIFPENGKRGSSFNGTNLPLQMDENLRGDTIEYLLHSAQEVERIAALLDESGYALHRDTGFQATEESIRSIGQSSPSPHILHIATHGFFFSAPSQAQKNSSSAASDGEPVFRLSDNPMLRSGLKLAFAQQTWSTGIPPENREDGLLNAFQISQMNLSNTELVVLSACETARGDIIGNEGVYGLQRAIKIAGTRYLIMSLWRVEDETTRQLMTSFYAKWLDKTNR